MTAMHVGPILAVADVAAARTFYEEALGLRGEETPGGWALHGAGGSKAYLLQVEGADRASWPVASFEVDDVHATVRALRARGVRFLGSDELPFELDAEGVSVDQRGLHVAWLRDPDENVLTVFSTGGS